MTAHHFYEPRNGHRLRHDPLNAIVAPRPIGWISTVSTDGKRNLAPYSFFNLLNYRPPIITFCSNGWKDSVANAATTGEFVWNLVSRPLAEKMNASAVATDQDEFGFADIATLPSRMVRADRVSGSPAQFECRTTQVIQLKDATESLIDSWLVLGEVVAVHIDPAMLVDGVYVTTRGHPIVRGGGMADYFEIGEDTRFEMHRLG